MSPATSRPSCSSMRRLVLLLLISSPADVSAFSTRQSRHLNLSRQRIPLKRPYVSAPLLPPLFQDKSQHQESKKQRLLPPSEELKKMVPLGIMFFCILFNYTILRSTKDVLMVTAPKSGAEVIPFLKTYVNLPAALGFTALYVELTETMTMANVFYTLVGPFLAFFASFPVLIYPNHAFLHPHEFVDLLQGRLHHGFAAPLAIARNWSFSVFYVLAELWGSVVTSLLFWGFANQVTTVPEAKKYYPLFGMGANFALIAAGQYIKWVGAREALLCPSVDAWAVSLRYLMGAVVASGAMLVGTYSYMQRKVVTKLKEDDDTTTTTFTSTKKEKKTKPTLRQSLQLLWQSKYLRDLAILVVSSAMCINVVEVSWKAKLKLLYPDPNSYSKFMGDFATATGVATLSMMVLGRYIFDKFKWGTAALVTPFMMGCTGLAFFAWNVAPPGLATHTAALLGTTPLVLAVLIGAMQNILSKSSKYSLFDPCKEMAFIPLDQNSKTKGKAAIDVVGVLLGKSGASLLQQVLILITGSLASATPFLSIFLTGVIFFWFRATRSLAVQFEEAMASTTSSSSTEEKEEG